MPALSSLQRSSRAVKASTEIADADAEKLPLVGLIEGWWAERGERPSGVSDLWPLADELDLVGDSGSDRARRTRFGRVLAGLRGRHVAGFVIEPAGVLHGSGQWRLRKEQPDAVGDGIVLPFPSPVSRPTSTQAVFPSTDGEASEWRP